MKTLIFTTLAATFAFAMATNAFSAEPIVGDWKTQEGETAGITQCGGSFCIKLKTGTYAGQQIGKMSGSGADYTGTITDPADNKEYSGSAKVGNTNMKLKGCALKIFCKTVNWKRL